MTAPAGQKLTETFLDKAHPALFRSDDFAVGDIVFNQVEGLGGTIVNQTWPLSSFVAFMTPATFLSLASPGVVHDSKDFILRGLSQYAGTDKFPLASPYLWWILPAKPPALKAMKAETGCGQSRRWVPRTMCRY